MEAEIRCPTCRARQAMSDECRRCKCDLTMFVTAIRHRQQVKRQCLTHLRDGEFDQALVAAQQHCKLSSDKEASRLLAVTLLLTGRFKAALEIAERQSS